MCQGLCWSLKKQQNTGTAPTPWKSHPSGGKRKQILTYASSGAKKGVRVRVTKGVHCTGNPDSTSLPGRGW